MDNNNGSSKKERFEAEALLHLNSLYNMSLRLTRNEDDAKDLVQETFYKAYKFFHQFQQGTSIKAWLFKILKNSYINVYRKKVRQPEMIEYDKVAPFISLIKDDRNDNKEEIEAKVLDKLLDDEITAALNKLPDEFRMVVLLSDLEGLSYKEISDIMECPIGTVRSRLSRGRRMLQKVLLDYALKEGIIKGKEK
ncbi:sigma-70 family RNA polymerase sigma factor [bacterium]|nr:sigma-70 family RNA polymerase sigma factor [bacterium]